MGEHNSYLRTNPSLSSHPMVLARFKHPLSRPPSSAATTCIALSSLRLRSGRCWPNHAHVPPSLSPAMSPSLSLLPTPRNQACASQPPQDFHLPGSGGRYPVSWPLCRALGAGRSWGRPTPPQPGCPAGAFLTARARREMPWKEREKSPLLCQPSGPAVSPPVSPGCRGWWREEPPSRPSRRRWVWGGVPAGREGAKAAAIRAGQGLRWDPPVPQGRRGGTVRGREPAPLAAPVSPGSPGRRRRDKGPPRSSCPPAGGTVRPLRRRLFPQGRAHSGVSEGEAPRRWGDGGCGNGCPAAGPPHRLPCPLLPRAAGHRRRPPGTGREPEAPWQTAPSHLGADAKEPERVRCPQGRARARQPPRGPSGAEEKPSTEKKNTKNKKPQRAPERRRRAGAVPAGRRGEGAARGLPSLPRSARSGRRTAAAGSALPKQLKIVKSRIKKAVRSLSWGEAAGCRGFGGGMCPSPRAWAGMGRPSAALGALGKIGHFRGKKKPNPTHTHKTTKQTKNTPQPTHMEEPQALASPQRCPVPRGWRTATGAERGRGPGPGRGRGGSRMVRP